MRFQTWRIRAVLLAMVLAAELLGGCDSEELPPLWDPTVEYDRVGNPQVAPTPWPGDPPDAFPIDHPLDRLSDVPATPSTPPSTLSLTTPRPQEGPTP